MVPVSLLFLAPLLACSGGGAADLRVLDAAEVSVLPRHAAIRGRDGGPSALFQGRSVWTFGDTVLEQPDERGETWHTNSWQHADPSRWRDEQEQPLDGAGVPALFIDLSEEERAWDEAHAAEDCAQQPCGSRWAIWPSAPLVHPTEGHAWLLYLLLNEHHDSGVGLARWEGLDQPVQRQAVGDGWLLFPAPEPEFSNGALVEGEHLYAFACEQDGWDRPCSLARVDIDRVAERDAWRFFDGAAWSSDIADRAALFDGAPIISVAWNPALNRWLAVYSRPFEHHAFARTAERIEGPWSRETKLFRIPGEPAYDLNQHAELAEEDGLVLWLSLSRATEDGWFAAEHVLWRVELAPRGR